MAPVKIKHMRNMLMELRKVCQHPYLSAPELENEDLPEKELHKQLVEGSGKLAFLKLLLPKLKERGHRILLFSQFKIALDRIEDFLYGEGYKFLRLDGDVQQAQRQKSMDAFNAPNSEYFIFLLTTRAGGVGINLATADTVILYDPDFNPHQDLQAIARSHRYGQTKKVLVFKLMTKNTVEERIIEKTKKKLVLDHLVVQSMEEAHEEGEIDDLILHGAKALYEADADGVAPSDIHYNSKNVEELIDKVEREAEEEAKAMEEREKEKERKIANGEDEDKDKPREAMTFGFAKIWEAGQDALAEVEDALEEEKELEDQTLAWESVMESARQAEARRLADKVEARAQRLRRQKNTQRYQPDGVLSDDSPQVKRVKGKGKGKGKATTPAINDSSDGDFALPVDGSDSDVSDNDLSDEADALVDENGRPILVPSKKNIVNEARHTAWQAARDAVKAAKAGKVQNDSTSRKVSPPKTTTSLPNSLAGPSAAPDSVRNETPEERKARKARRKTTKEAARQAQMQQLLLPSGSISSAPGRPLDHRLYSTTSTGDRAVINNAQLTDAARISEGQAILQWLWRLFVELDFSRQIRQWAKMALPELTVEERTQHYRELAQIADDQLLRLGQQHFFTRPETYHNVCYLFQVGAPALPEEGTSNQPIVPPLPAGARRGGDIHMRQDPGTNIYRQNQPDYRSPAPAPQAILAQSRQVLQHQVKTPKLARHMGSPRVHTSVPPTNIARPIPVGSPESHPRTMQTPVSPIPVKTAPFASLMTQSISQVQPTSLAVATASTATTTSIRTAEELGQSISSTSSCPFCKEWHKLSDCPIVPSLKDLRYFRAAILNSNEKEVDIAESLEELDKVLRLYQNDGVDVSDILNLKQRSSQAASIATNGTPGAGPSVRAPTVAMTQVPVNGTRMANGRDVATTATGTGDHAIEIHDDSGDERPMKRPRTQATPRPPYPESHPAQQGSKEPSNHFGPLGVIPANGVAVMPHRGRPGRFLGCTICRSSRFHPAAQCPIVLAGPASISAVLRQLSPMDGVYPVLSRILEDLETPESCPFCDAPCGRTSRECAEGNGGRKALKDLIRALDKEREHGEVVSPERLKRREIRMGKLYDCYQAWPKG